MIPYFDEELKLPNTVRSLISTTTLPRIFEHPFTDVNEYVNQSTWEAHEFRDARILRPEDTGNCVDSAVTKFVFLVLSGIPEEMIRLVSLRRQNQDGYHLVPIVHAKSWGTYIVLDIGTDDPQLLADYLMPGDEFSGQYLGGPSDA